MKRGSSDGGGCASNDAFTCAPGLLTLPPELRLEEFLDGGGIGGTQDLYSLSVLHRALANYAGLATRLDVRFMACHTESVNETSPPP